MNREDIDAVDVLCKEVLKYIKKASKEKTANDRTYRTVIKGITKKGYVVLDEAGKERTVPCCIPGLELRPMQSVWVKEPMGEIRNLHICGVVGNTNNPS